VIVECPFCGDLLEEGTIVGALFARQGTTDAAELRELARIEGLKARLWDCDRCGLWFCSDALPVAV